MELSKGRYCAFSDDCMGVLDFMGNIEQTSYNPLIEK